MKPDLDRTLINMTAKESINQMYVVNFHTETVPNTQLCSDDDDDGLSTQHY